jgi:hypothetical protein
MDLNKLKDQQKNVLVSNEPHCKSIINLMRLIAENFCFEKEISTFISASIVYFFFKKDKLSFF